MIQYKYVYVFVIFLTFISLGYVQGQNDNISLWAASDGVKVDKSDLYHPFKTGNYTWDKDTIKIFGAQN